MDSYKFYLKAGEFFKSQIYVTGEEANYNKVASIILSWISLESYINGAFSSLMNSKRLEDHIKLFLNEKEFRVSEEGYFIQINSRPSTTKKILFLINNFSTVNVKKFKQSNLWRGINNLEDLRNRIIHHKDSQYIEIKNKDCEEYHTLIIQFIRYMNKKVFHL